MNMLLQNAFEKFGTSIKNFFINLDPIEAWGVILMIIGVIFVFLLVFFTEYKRPERDSIKFTSIIIILASICLGLGLHMILIAGGLW